MDQQYISLIQETIDNYEVRDKQVSKRHFVNTRDDADLSDGDEKESSFIDRIKRTSDRSDVDEDARNPSSDEDTKKNPEQSSDDDSETPAYSYDNGDSSDKSKDSDSEGAIDV